ncbi:MAG: AbrB/MazE/SpoVT family DNA-binding domain-containing protein, partial [Terriglobales bacterium]
MAEIRVAKLNDNGRIVIPKAMREAPGIKSGDEVLLRRDENGILLYTRAIAVRAIQRELRGRVSPGASIVDELITERRAEFEREEAEGARIPSRRRRV